MAVCNPGARIAVEASVKRSWLVAVPPQQAGFLRCNCSEIRAIGTAVNLR
jgi:hypothetical protein